MSESDAEVGKLMDLYARFVTETDSGKKQGLDHALRAIPADQKEVMQSAPFQQGVNKLVELMQKMDTLQRQIRDSEARTRELEKKALRLDLLESDPVEAYNNYRRIADRLQETRVGKVEELRALDEKLSAAGIRTQENPGWGQATLAIALALIITVALSYLLSTISGKQTTPNFEVTYDVAQMTEALLLGSGALIAGVAYAISALRPNAHQS